MYIDRCTSTCECKSRDFVYMCFQETYEAAVAEVQPWRTSVDQVLGKIGKPEVTELR